MRSSWDIRYVRHRPSLQPGRQARSRRRPARRASSWDPSPVDGAAIIPQTRPTGLDGERHERFGAVAELHAAAARVRELAQPSLELGPSFRGSGRDEARRGNPLHQLVRVEFLGEARLAPVETVEEHALAESLL